MCRCILQHATGRPLSLTKRRAPEASAVPPFQYPQGAEGVPATGRANAFQFKKRLALEPVPQQPPAVPALAAADDVDRVGEAPVARRLDGLKVIEGPEDVI